MMPYIARSAGATVIEINPEPTPLTGDISDYILTGPAGEVMDRLVTAVEAAG
jgi:NAD-dependent deacetylase